ncbi:c-type cytochrome [Colwellia sp. Bg11-12]|uniref:c-type cytochrome n=1 Tax=Colwellia sp. Bg11-12 TaxID=2759817 RepID=UPI0015F5C456|nr:c-type cytochrome [Colwellia sp. Bg11-12]MBA6265816.1 cytochrome C [Colwellia sp. Bg11-12]
MKTLIIGIFFLFIFTIVSCDNGPDSPRGFSLPQGDVAKGKAVFLKYECLSCHILEGVQQPDIKNTDNISVKIGRKTTKVKTYAELVTAIINPSHSFSSGYAFKLIQKDGKSLMKNFNDVMTVAELVDLVVFLQPQYELVPYSPTRYQYYGY